VKRHILVALIVSLIVLGAVGSVSADDPLPQGVNIVPTGIEPQGTCPDSYVCNLGGYAHYVRNDNVNGTAVLAWHNNAAGTAPGLYGYSGSSTAYSQAVLGTSGSAAPGSNATGVRGISAGTSGAGIGVWGSQNGSGWGVYGYTPRGIGVYGNSSSGYGLYGGSGTGTGAFGYHASSTGTSPGVYGYSLSTAASANAVLGIVGSSTPGGSSSGVRGINNGTSGNGIGVWGSQNGSGYGVLGTTPRGIAVYGSTSTGIGVYGTSSSYYGVYGASTSATGVLGYHVATTGTSAGVYGYSNSRSASAPAVLGVISYNAPGGNSTGVRGINNGTSGAGIGVWGSQNGSGWGVLGSTPSGTGVYGSTGSGLGVYGQSSTGYGVVGVHSATTGNQAGVYGASNAPAGWAVVGAGPSYTTGYAGVFFGRVWVGGLLVKAGGGFRIDHPLDPANKYLYHSFVESPDMTNLYNGNVVLDANGQAWVTLPDYFEALNRDFRYQLTAIGSSAPRLHIASEISGNRFRIAGGREGQKVSWQVTGIRQDAFANAYRIPVEEDKPEAERGLYAHPELYGASKDKSLLRLAGDPAGQLEPGSAFEQEVSFEAAAVEPPALIQGALVPEASAEELYPLPTLGQEPPTSTEAVGVEAP
jgi:hypothetical protein